MTDSTLNPNSDTGGPDLHETIAAAVEEHEATEPYLHDTGDESSSIADTSGEPSTGDGGRATDADPDLTLGCAEAVQ